MSTDRPSDLRRLNARPEEIRTAVLYTVFASGYLLVAAARLGAVARGLYRYGEDPAEYAMFPGLLFLVVLGLWTGAVVLFSGDSHGPTVVSWVGLTGAVFSGINFVVLGTGRADLPGYPSTLVQGVTAGGVVVSLLLRPVANQEAIRRWHRSQAQLGAVTPPTAPVAHLTRSPGRPPDHNGWSGGGPAGHLTRSPGSRPPDHGSVPTPGHLGVRYPPEG